VLVSLTFLKDTVAAAGTALLLGAAAMSSQQDPAAVNAPRQIDIVATRYKFEPERVEVAAGEHVKLVVTSGDGVHGVEIKRLKINKKVPRDGEVTIDLVATEAGEFPILCSEYCGKGHDVMKGMLVVAAKSAR
jgi:cytochrome c oxidase subunit 2